MLQARLVTPRGMFLLVVDGKGFGAEPKGIITAVTL